jgi:hypothetical protein
VTDATTTDGSTVSERAIRPGLSWTARIPLLNNRFMMWDFAKVIVISTAALWLLVLVASLFVDPSDPVLLPWQLPVLCAGILAVLFVIACLLLGNGYSARFLIDGEGVHWDSGPKEKKINRAVVVMGALAGSAQTTGAGLLAASEESGAIAWRSIGRLNIHPRQRVVSVRNGWRVVVRLYVPADSWDAVVERLQAGIAPASHS